MNLLNKVDLESSFEKLKKTLKEATNELESGKEGRYAYGFGRLAMAIKLHLVNSTVDETLEGIQRYIADRNNPDDLKNVL